MEGPETRFPHRTDPLIDLLYLERTGNVHDYFNTFKLLLARVEISEDLAIEVFLRGLEPEIQTLVRSFKPNDLYVAYSLARLKESTLSVLGVKEDVVVDEFGEENGLEYAKKGSENVVVLEVFDEMLEKIIDVDDCIEGDMEELPICTQSPNAINCPKEDLEKNATYTKNSMGHKFEDVDNVVSNDDQIDEMQKEGNRGIKVGGGSESGVNIAAATSGNNREEETSWTKRVGGSLRIKGNKDELKSKKDNATQLVRKRLLYSKTQKGNLRLGFDEPWGQGSLKGRVLIRFNMV